MTPLRVAVLAESETDDAVAREIVASVRQVEVGAVVVPSLGVRGWHSMLRQLPTVVRTVHYQSDADALLVLADTDASVPHAPAHRVGARPPDCRWCLLSEALYGSGPPYRNQIATARTLIRGVLATPGALGAAFPGGYGPLEDAIGSW